MSDRQSPAPRKPPPSGTSPASSPPQTSPSSSPPLIPPAPQTAPPPTPSDPAEKSRPVVRLIAIIDLIILAISFFLSLMAVLAFTIYLHLSRHHKNKKKQEQDNVIFVWIAFVFIILGIIILSLIQLVVILGLLTASNLNTPIDASLRKAKFYFYFRLVGIIIQILGAGLTSLLPGPTQISGMFGMLDFVYRVAACIFVNNFIDDLERSG